MASTLHTKLSHLQIPLEDVLNATNNFHQDNVIGHGGLGTAYKGQLLRSGNLIKISALRVDRKQGEGDVEFWTEISMLSDLNHTNLVSIIGFCDEKHEKVIITTYAAKGSLEKHLNNPNLTWTQRLRICVGVARALSYLHHDEGRDYAVIHLNINSTSILLDENWDPKLSGFKVSVKQSVHRMDRVILSEPIGSIGYVDPEIEKTKGVTHKSDIYSFGVVLFELLCGRRAYIKNEANKFLAGLAKYHYENGTLQDIVYTDIRNQMSPYSLRIYSNMAYSCLEKERTDRPNILTIVDKLEKALKQALKFKPDFRKNLEHLKIQLHDIKLVTNTFSDKYRIGSNNYYTWYMVELGHFDNENTFSTEGKSKSELPKRHNTGVMKRFLPIDDEQEENLFFTELEMLTSVKHHNIVNILGFCVEGFEMIIVTENFSNGNLASDYLENIQEMGTLTWEKRLKICIDVARALNYLHFEMEDNKLMIHGNINCARIGFYENWEAKIEDFEWAVFLPSDQKDKAVYRKTYFDSWYHVDPEYENTGMLKRETDVYSFGVVLFEIVCGRFAGDQIYLKESEKGLVDVARRNFFTGTLEDMIDNALKEETGIMRSIPNRRINKDSLQIFLKIANQCVIETQEKRPTMKVVLQELDKALFIQIEDYNLQQLDKDQDVIELEAATNDELLVEGVHQLDKDQVVQELETPNQKLLEERELQPEDEFLEELEIPSHEIHQQQLIIIKKLEHLKIPLTHIQLATDGFSNKYQIPAGDDYMLYRAELGHFGKENHSSVERTVVIKRYPSGHHLYTKNKFFREINMLSSVNHPNIVTLLGFCVEDSEMILVTENVYNGYLVDHLRNVDRMRIFTWEKRLKICIGVAHALSYLHFEMEDQKVIIHRDINSHSIGLDENLRTKIADFWFSVIVPPNQQDVALYLNWIGRSSYVDPEYKNTCKLKRESDVYGLGVVLFEILCGRTSFDPIYLKEHEIGLAHVARRCYRSGTMKDLIDPLIKEENSENNFVLNSGPNKDSLHTFIEIAYQCVAETQDQRPTINVVLKELQKALFFQNNNMNNPIISLEDIKVATQNFYIDNCIGGGGFGGVFKGKLQDGDGFKTIVAKRLDTRLGQGEQQFWNELQILLEYKHENIIGLIGYCDEKDENVIVYEYAPKGSLDRYLKDVSLTWMRRLMICIDVATALYFLHGGFGKQAKVIHRDIKTANILLNHEWEAKLGDFGLSLISPITQKTEYVIDYACGTRGYVDPLYEKSRFLTIESDIYSFGVVLFEILCGRSTFENKKHEGQYLPEFVRNIFEEGKHDEVVFEQIREQIEPKSLAIFQKIAYQCLYHEREKRPTTKNVLMQLKNALEIQNMVSAVTKFAHLKIPLKDVVKATNNFNHDNVIGHGGYSTTYKGRLLQSGRLMTIAAQRFDCKHVEADLAFFREISVLNDLKHTNLIYIVGFCDEEDEKIILTMYEANRCLGQHLSNTNLTWTKRLRICLGVARALSYLHYSKGRDYAIIHCNISSDTIFLDENWEAKLSGFETSIKQSVYKKDQVCLCEHIGTMGCMDPAIEKTGGVTHKSDIYSFGVFLFEILCGRKAFVQNEAKSFLASLARYHYENKTLQDIICSDLHWNRMSPQSLLKYSDIAYSCLNEDQADRPNMETIVAELEEALELQLRRENIEKKFEYLKISLADIKSATDDFSETYKIASTHDEYTSYRAELNHFDKDNSLPRKGMNREQPNVIYIKRYPFGHKYYGEEEFYTEIETLSGVKHPNIVTLLGFCFEASEMILVTENVSDGHLVDYLENINDKRILTWEKRLKICIDVAHALKYLHYGMEAQKVIIHRNVSSKGVALDENLGAKIGDFVASVFLPPNQKDEALYLDLIGRPCYIDPEYVKIDRLKRESDVYGFGVVLFEILSGRTAYDPIYQKENELGLAPVARQSFSTGTLEEMIDPLIREETSGSILKRGTNKDSLHTFIKIAHQCVSETQDQRPTMKVVVKELQKALFLQVTYLQRSNLEQLKIRLNDIKLATDNFSEPYKVGVIGYYTFYRAGIGHFDKANPSSVKGKNEGELPQRHNTVIIKRILPRDDEQGEEVFYREIQMLMSVMHRNIVTLLGFCDDESEMILVINNLSNGYLGDFLRKVNGMHNFNWEKRLKICIDVAHALNYLHYEMEDQKMIINRDIRSDYIGLDVNYLASIADFGLSLFLPPNQQDEAIHLKMIAGTKIYTDPEYAKTGKLKRESDTYSFGVVLFEMLCGRTAYDPIYRMRAEEGLATVARHSLSTGTIEEMIDPIIKEETNEHDCLLIKGPNKDSLHTFIKIAHQCVAETQDKRPTMKVVVKQLEKALFFQENNKDSLRIPLEDIEQATQNFHDDNCIGEGEFGKIYKGKLQDGDEFKTIVAKRLDTRLGQVEKPFLSELQILWEYKHENVIGLVGYCDEHEEKVIVYEYASRRSLDMYLNDATLTWMKRLSICIDAASVLDFIHGGVRKQTKVIHGDIKTANILLNHEWKAKLAGFGLSLISPITQDIKYVIDYACGTPGYMDPLYKKSGYLTIESDVYSFGVVMFEILCGRTTFVTHEHEGRYLPEFIKSRFEEGKQNEVVFEQIREHIVPESLATFQEIAYQCLHVEREKRPTTKEVLMQLKMALEFQVPTKPKVNDQSIINIEEIVINIEETNSADDIDQPNLDTNESDKCLDMPESQKKEVEDYVHAYRSPAKEVFMNWTSRQREYFVVLCRELQINPEDMDGEEEVAS